MLAPGAGPWTIGRDPACHLQCLGRRVSREHAEISLKGPVVSLRDLGSTNGTFLNGSRIQQVPFKPGAVFRCDQVVGMLLKVNLAGCMEDAFTEVSEGFYAGPTLRQVLDPLGRVASSDLPVLIEGATGTGKERVARFVHERSGRSGPFHAINCAALPPELAETELFGHRQGAFTGAQQAALGHLRAAEGGTLFLDEIEELSLPLQAKLLRVIQEGEVTPVGSHKPVRVDVRFVSACQRPLDSRVEQNAFREDLFSRLAGFVVQLPRLSEHPEDIPGLFIHFLRKHSSGTTPQVDAVLIERLCLYDWPRNVRELELLARQLLALNSGVTRLKRSHLPAHIRVPTSELGETDHSVKEELSRLIRALHDCSGNISHASARLGISRSRAYRLMRDQTVDQVMARRIESKDAEAET